MAERWFAAVLILLFGLFFYIAAGDLVRLIEKGALGDTFLLLFCVIASLSWIVFLAALFLRGHTAEQDLAGSPLEAWIKD